MPWVFSTLATYSSLGAGLGSDQFLWAKKGVEPGIHEVGDQDCPRKFPLSGVVCFSLYLLCIHGYAARTRRIVDVCAFTGS